MGVHENLRSYCLAHERLFYSVNGARRFEPAGDLF